MGADHEPEPKRKTLTERAGEPRSIAATSTSSRPAVKGMSLVGASVSYFMDYFAKDVFFWDNIDIH